MTTPSPERAPAEPNEEAALRAEIKRVCWGRFVSESEFDQLLDRFRAASVREERLRCAAIVASESFNDEDAFDRMERNILSGASP